MCQDIFTAYNATLVESNEWKNAVETRRATLSAVHKFGHCTENDGAFRLEREMVDSARSWLVNRGLLVKQEFQTPWGVCDLVGVSLFRRRVRQRLNLGQRTPIGPPRRIALLNLIPDLDSQVSITSNQLAEELQGFVPLGDLDKQLSHLVESGFAIRDESGRFQKLNGWIPLHKRIVALELKLRRVDEALFQAASHLKFATEAYVGLPEKVALRVLRGKTLARFKECEVGLLAVAPGRCRLLFRPEGRASQADLTLQMHCVERFWRSHIISNSP